jgi:hypothetical protein
VEPVVRAVERALKGSLDRPYTHLTSLDFSNAFNTVDRRDIAEGLRQYAPILYRAGRWAYGCTSSLVLGSPEGRHIITSAQGVRQGDPMGPLMFSLGILSLLRDLASALGPNRLILAYLDDIYILSPDDQALEQTLAFFDERQPSIRLNPAKCKSLALEDIRTEGLRMLGTCVGARSAREQFLQEKIDHETATIAKLINLPHQHALLVLRVCVQQNLRHLQRSLKSDDLVHLWDKLDTVLREAVARIRGLPRPTDQLDATVISLPIKMGGVVLSPNQDGRCRHPVLQDGRTPRLCYSYRGGGHHARTHPHPRNPPGQHPTYHPTPTLPGDLYREQGGTAWLADPRTGQGHGRGIVQARQGLAHHDTIPAISPPHRL